MNLRWVDFEKSVGARIEPYDGRKDMGFWQWFALDLEYKNASQLNDIFSNRRLFVIRGLPSLIFVLVYCFADDARFAMRPDMLITMTGFWTMGVAVFRAQVIRFSGDYPDYRSLWMLPLSPDEIFRRFLRNIAINLGWLALEVLLVFSALAFAVHHPLANLGLGVVCAILEAAMSLTITLLMLRWNMRIGVFGAILVFWTLVLGTWGTIHGDQSTRLAFGDLANPMGWVPFMYLNGWIRGSAQAWWLLAPVGLIMATIPSSLKAVRRAHHRGAFRKQSPKRGLNATESTQEARPEPANAFDLRRQLLSSDFLQPLPWNARGPLERLIKSFLGARETELAQALLVSPATWLKNLVKLVFCLACIVVARKLIEIRLFWWSEYALVLSMVLLLITTFARMFALFVWAPLEMNYRLLPVRGFELWKTGAKLNAAIFTVLLSLTALVPYHLFRMHLAPSDATGHKSLPLIATTIGSLSFFASWTQGIRKFGTLNPWLFRFLFWSVFATHMGIAYLLIISSLLSVGNAYDGEIGPVLMLAFALIAASIAWGLFCEALERRAWKRQIPV